jgi:hypothetical protein
MKNHLILPLEHARADEALASTRRTLAKKDEESAPGYSVRFIHPSENSVSAYLIHKESNAAVGILNWNSDTGILGDFDVNGHHRKNGESGGRLLSEAWKYAKTLGIGGPCDSALHSASTWRVQRQFNPNARGFASHPFSKSDPTSMQFYGSSRRTEVDPNFKGYQSERDESSYLERHYDYDIASAADTTSRQGMLDSIVSRNAKDEKKYVRGEAKVPETVAAPSDVVHPEKDLSRSCPACGGRGQHSVVAPGVSNSDSPTFSTDTPFFWIHLPDTNRTDANVSLTHPSTGQRFDAYARTVSADYLQQHGAVITNHPNFPAFDTFERGPAVQATLPCHACDGTGAR